MSFQYYNHYTKHTVICGYFSFDMYQCICYTSMVKKRCVLLSGFDTIYSCIQTLLNGNEIEKWFVTKSAFEWVTLFYINQIMILVFWQQILLSTRVFVLPWDEFGLIWLLLCFLYLIHSKKQLLLSLQWHFYTQHKRGHCSMLLHYYVLYHLLLGKRGKRMPV